MKLTLSVGDVGIPIRLTVVDSIQQPIDLSASTTREYRYIKPSGAVTVAPAVFVTDGVDGKLSSATVVGLLDQEGGYKVQVHIISPGEDWKTTALDFNAVDFLTNED